MIGSLEWMTVEFELAERGNRQMTNVALRADDGQRVEVPLWRKMYYNRVSIRILSRIGGLLLSFLERCR